MRHPAPHRPGTAAARVAATVIAVALLVAGCGDDDDDGGGDGQAAGGGATTTTTAAQPTSTTTTSSTTSTTAASTTTTSRPASTTTTTAAPFEGSTDRIEIPRPATTTESVNHTTLSVTSGGGEERIAMAFQGGLPGVVVEYVDRPVRESGSGDEVAVAGGAVLALRFEPASSARIEGDQVTRTYTGPDRVPGPGPGATMVEMVRIGDFEAVYEWAVGVRAEVPFRVETGPGTVTVVLPAG